MDKALAPGKHLTLIFLIILLTFNSVQLVIVKSVRSFMVLAVSPCVFFITEFID